MPLGSAEVAGLVVSVFERQPVPSPQKQVHYTALRPILSIGEDSEQAPLGRNLFQLIEKISDYYLVPLSACLRLIVPLTFSEADQACCSSRKRDVPR